MNIFVFISLLLVIVPSKGHSSWLCRVAASERNGDVINACGIAEAPTESEARAKSREAAFEELDSICEKTPECSNFEYSIQPLRTDCEKTTSGYKCFRGIEATLSNKPRKEVFMKGNGRDILVPVRKAIDQDDLLAKKIERTIVTFNSKPSKVNVSVDGITICRTPCSREIQNGKHQITFENEDYEKKSEEIEISPKISEVNWQLNPLYGYLEILDLPEQAVVKIDDMLTEYSQFKLSPGLHILSIESPDNQPFNQEVMIKKGMKAKVNYDANPLFGLIVVSCKDKSENALRAKIFIDGKDTKELTPAKIKIAAGEREIEIVNSDRSSKIYRKIKPNTVYNLNFVLDFSVSQKNIRPKNLRSKGCYSDDDCSSGKVCATIKGEYPGGCASRGGL